ncbi:hypothetical protein U1Q18_007782 [Sarracenia purpurea var. burkii]
MVVVVQGQIIDAKALIAASVCAAQPRGFVLVSQGFRAAQQRDRAAQRLAGVFFDRALLHGARSPPRRSILGTVDRAVVISDTDDTGAGVRALKAFFEMKGFTRAPPFPFSPPPVCLCRRNRQGWSRSSDPIGERDLHSLASHRVYTFTLFSYFLGLGELYVPDAEREKRVGGGIALASQNLFVAKRKLDFKKSASIPI